MVRRSAFSVLAAKILMIADRFVPWTRRSSNPPDVSVRTPANSLAVSPACSACSIRFSISSCVRSEAEAIASSKATDRMSSVSAAEDTGGASGRVNCILCPQSGHLWNCLADCPAWPRSLRSIPFRSLPLCRSPPSRRPRDAGITDAAASPARPAHPSCGPVRIDRSPRTERPKKHDCRPTTPPRMISTLFIHDSAGFFNFDDGETSPPRRGRHPLCAAGTKNERVPSGLKRNGP